MSADSPLLEVTGLDVFYGDFQALFGVSMTVVRGGARRWSAPTARARPRCCGRSPALSRPPLASSASIGADITKAPPYRRVASGIALVPEGRRLFPSLTVEENIKVGAVAAASGTWPLDRSTTPSR